MPTATATAVATATTAVDRACPDPPPTKPAYLPNYLPNQPWPTPQPGPHEPHFWLSDPVAGGRKLFEQAYYPYGWDGGGRFLLHNGADMPQALGTAVTAVADGTILIAQSDVAELFGWRCDWYGQLVVQELDEQWLGQPVYILYGHVQNLAVQPGQRVQTGDPIAEIGVEGVSLVPHLHLEVRVGTNEFDSTRNPLLWLPPLPGYGVVAGRLVDAALRPWQGTRVTLIDTSSGEAQFISTFTYLDDPQHLIRPDEQLAENFVFADLPPGNYTLYTQIQGVEYRAPVEVRAGELTTVEMVTELYEGP